MPDDASQCPGPPAPTRRRPPTIGHRGTGWAAIIAVPTAVTGFYGQNVPYPGFGHTAGFIVSTVIMVLLSVGCTSRSAARTGSERTMLSGPESMALARNRLTRASVP
jgi:hypothetical protein